MKRILWALLAVCLLASTSCTAAEKDADIASEPDKDSGDWKILDLGEPTPEEKAEMERERHARETEESGYLTMEDMAEGTTEEERTFGGMD